MTRTIVISLGLAGVLVACAKPEPEPSPAAAPTASPAVQAPELEYVDPLEAARAEARAQAEAAGPGDESWREGFDRREPAPAEDGVDEGAMPMPTPGDEASGAVLREATPEGTAPLPTAPPPPSADPIPTLVPGMSPRDPNGVEHRSNEPLPGPR